MQAQRLFKEHHQPADVNHIAAGVRPKLRLVYKVHHFQPKAFASNDDSYDVNGHLTTLVSTQNYLYFDGRGVGDYGTGGGSPSSLDYAAKMAQEDAARNSNAKYTATAITSADFDYSFIPINSASGQASTYQVQAGDTLEHIAASVWGDSSLWYLIAEVNGFTSKDAPLSEGLTLTLPNVNTNFHNNVNTFKPYNPNDLLGNVQPTLPDAPAPKQSKSCGWKEVLVVVVAVVAAIWLGPWVGKMVGTALTTLGTTAATATFAGAVATGVAGGAAGSLAGQTAGRELGLEGYEHISWSKARDAGYVGGITAGVSESIGSIGFFKESTVLRDFSRAAITATVANGINSKLGYGTFRWRDSLTAGFSAIANTAIGNAANPNSLTDSANMQSQRVFDLGGYGGRAAAGFGTHLSAAILNESVRALVYSDDFNFTEVAGQSLGNTLGNAFFTTPQEQAVRKQKELDALTQKTGSLAKAETVAKKSRQNDGLPDGVIMNGMLPDLLDQVPGSAKVGNDVVVHGERIFEGEISASEEAFYQKQTDERGIRFHKPEESFLSESGEEYSHTALDALSTDLGATGTVSAVEGDSLSGYGQRLANFALGNILYPTEMTYADENGLLSRLREWSGIGSNDTAQNRINQETFNQSSFLGSPINNGSIFTAAEIGSAALFLGKAVAELPAMGNAIAKNKISSFETSLVRAEARIVGRKFETGFVIDDKGQILVQRSANRSSPGKILFTESELAQFKGNVFTHNHPSNLPLGPEDIANGIAYQSKEIRAVGNEFTSVVRFSDETFESLSRHHGNYGSSMGYIGGFQKQSMQNVMTKFNAGEIFPPSGLSQSQLQFWRVNQILEDIVTKIPGASIETIPTKLPLRK